MAEILGGYARVAVTRMTLWTTAMLLALVALSLPVQAEDLHPDVLETLRKATFEVVVEKPTTDSLSYEKELPYDLLPFRERNDKYESIGTAFALSNGQFVSAAHVISLASESLRRRVYLRDPEGKIIGLDKVLKYSVARDFIVFTVKKYRPAGVLKTSAKAKKNDKVFAVGNALGEGIIVRDGLYTSDTPEEEDGRWSWLRFSAAASPGNSGGPLVDGEGRVVGVVLRKSQNENLNFALPITEILKAPAGKAELYEKAIFRLDITDRTLQGKLDEKVDLPMDYKKFGEVLQQRFTQFTVSLAERFNTTYRDDMFPLSAGSQPMLYRTNVAATFPRLMVKQRDGTWDAVMPSDTREAELGKNGSLAFGKMGNYLFLKVKAPDDVSLSTLQSDSKQFMDLILRGLYFSRSFGAERVRITSLGPAKEESVFVDHYQRKWQVRRWRIEHSDEKIVTYALPTPGGYVIMMNAADDAASYMFEIDMKTLSDFIFVTYYGTLKRWKEFLENRKALPAAFDSIRIEADYGKEFRYQSDRLSLSYGEDVMKISEDSDLHLKFSYYKDKDRVVWDVSSLLVGESKDNSTFAMLTTHPRPPESLPDSDRRNWESVLKARMPYTGAAFFDKSRTVIASAFMPPDMQGDAAQQPMLFSVAYSTEGSKESALMEKKLNLLREGIRIKAR